MLVFYLLIDHSLLEEKTVDDDDLDDHLATELMNIALNHAYQNDFQKVEIEESVFKWLAKDHAAFAPRGLA